jgi:hypothetical protein
VAIGQQLIHQVRADKAATAGYQIVRHPNRIPALVGLGEQFVPEGLTHALPTS